VIAADLDGALSPPRDNGEIAFAAPWERRAFGLAVALCRSGTCEWESFRRRLIARIAEDEERPYWESWAAALEDLVTTSALAPADVDDRFSALLARPHGHDHR
jgi:nitrile hydratase accessory protein